MKLLMAATSAPTWAPSTCARLSSQWVSTISTASPSVSNISFCRFNSVCKLRAAAPTIPGNIVTDDTVPEGHAGLHGFLYGEGGAEGQHGSIISTSKGFTGLEGEDDGSGVVEFAQYVSARDGAKFVGVYEIQNFNGETQYVGYSRNVVLSLKGHRERVGQEKCQFVRVKAFSDESMVSRARLEEERQQWLQQLAKLPPGNCPDDNNNWELDGNKGKIHQAMSDQEREEYEEKKLKLRKAMGEKIHEDDDEEMDEDARTRRFKLMQAVEGDDWSSVIDGQSKQTIEKDSSNKKDMDSGKVDIVSPFQKADVQQESTGLYSAETFELTVQNVDNVLNEVRPYLIADGGNVEVLSVDGGIVSLRLQGACGTCPSSTSTMKLGIERVIREKFGDAVLEVVDADKGHAIINVASINSHLDMLRPAIQNYGGAVDVVGVDTATGECQVKYKGPAPLATGIQAAIKDKFPDITKVVILSFD